MSDGIVEREAARAIVLSPNRSVLLQLIEAESGRCWILPGGGLADGETHEQALMRELAEEVGLQAIELGPWVWRRTAEFTFRGVRYRQQERIFLAHAEPFEFDHSGLEEVEVGIVLGHSWWEIDEIESATSLVFWPRGLAQLLRPLVLGEVPRVPLEIRD
jgi:ADP-ribose pyrophosphatase YjhB (NUDIX family)